MKTVSWKKKTSIKSRKIHKLGKYIFQKLNKLKTIYDCCVFTNISVITIIKYQLDSMTKENNIGIGNKTRILNCMCIKHMKCMYNKWLGEKPWKNIQEILKQKDDATLVLYK